MQDSYIAGDIHLEGLSGHAVTLSEIVRHGYDEVLVPGQYECFYNNYDVNEL